MHTFNILCNFLSVILDFVQLSLKFAVFAQVLV